MSDGVAAIINPTDERLSAGLSRRTFRQGEDYMAGSTFNKPKQWRFTFNALGHTHMVETTVPHPVSALETAKRVMKIKHGLGAHEIQLVKSEKLA